MVSDMNSARRSLWKSRWLSLILFAADAVGFSICWTGAYHLRAALSHWMGPINDIYPYLRVHPLIVLIALANCTVFGLYIHRRRISSLNRPGTLLRAGYDWLLYIAVIGYLFKELDLGRSVIILCGLLGFVYLFASRTALRALKERAVRQGRGTVRSAIVGRGSLAFEVREFLTRHPEVGFSLVGLIVHGDEAPQSDQHVSVPVLGTTAQINEILEREQIEEVFLAIAHLEAREQLNLLNIAERPGISVHVVSNIFDVLTERNKVEEVGAFPVITLHDAQRPLHQRLIKSFVDLGCGIVGVILWLLCFHWWIALRIRMDSPGPILFSQDRVGQGGRVFRIWKYRTMHVETPVYAVAPTEEADPRVTTFGRWLRKTSLDELPQLLNVLRGEMSMVGPRPEMPFIVDKYEAWQRRRLDVKPGITGLWQVIGRKNLPLHLNMQYDFYYIKNQSFLLDIEILVRTIPAVLKGKGAF